jgi:hypothetical protein
MRTAERDRDQKTGGRMCRLFFESAGLRESSEWELVLGKPKRMAWRGFRALTNFPTIFTERSRKILETRGGLMYNLNRAGIPDRDKSGGGSPKARKRLKNGEVL